MEQLSLAIKKLFSLSLIFFVGFVMIFGVLVDGVSAQTAPGQTQGAGFVNGNEQPGGQSLTLSEQGAVNGISACAASVVGGVVGQLTMNLFKTSSSERFTEIPTFSNESVKTAGSQQGWPPSLDSVGYCIINAVLEYLTQATIEWINSGFDGNPAFVSDPEKFFADIAEAETVKFLDQIVGGATGIDICQPFRLQIVTGLSGGVGGGDQFANQARCSFDDISAALGASGVDFDYNEYTSGRAEYSGSLDVWKYITQNDQNNRFGAESIALKELDRRLSRQQNSATLDLTMGRGFLSVKSCTEDSTTTDANGNTVPVKGTCRITTPGGVIEDQANRALGAGRERLVFADKFDQIITSLVNQLIQTALSEVLAEDEEN